MVFTYISCNIVEELNFMEQINSKEEKIDSLKNIDEIYNNLITNTTEVICNHNNCPSFQGVCYDNECICSHGFATHNEFNTSNTPIIYCNYKLKSKFVAFFLELFFPFGAGHLYAGNNILAMIKFISFSMIICSCCGILCTIALEDKGCGMKCFVIFFIFMIVFWILFELIDLFCYAFGIYKDGNGIPML